MQFHSTLTRPELFSLAGALEVLCSGLPKLSELFLNSISNADILLGAVPVSCKRPTAPFQIAESRLFGIPCENSNKYAKHVMVHFL